MPRTLSPNRKTKIQKEKEKEIDSALRTIYSTEDGKQVDVKTIDRHPRRRARGILFLVLAFLALVGAVSWAGFFIFKPYGRFSGGNVKLSFEQKGTLVAGAPAEIVVHYANRERVPLGTFEMTLTLPDGFELTEAAPAATDKHRWIIGTVDAGSDGSVTLRGVVKAAEGSDLVFQAFGRYVPGNFNSEFQSVGSATLKVEGAIIGLSAVIPPDALPGDVVTETITYENKSSDAIANAAVRLTPPPDFIISETTPTHPADNLRFDLGAVPAGEKKTVTVKGSFAATALGTRTFSAEAGTAKDRTFNALTRRTDSVEVKTSEIKLTLLVNGSATGTPVKFGEPLRISYSYENVSAAPIKDLQLALTLDAVPTKDGQTPIDWTGLEMETPGDRRGNKITWTRKQVGEGVIDLTVPLRNAPFAGAGDDYHITVSAEARFASRAIKTNPLVFPIVSDARFSAGARYYNDDEAPVGTGPLPPKVGAQTALRIFWKIKNTLHELSALRVTAPLPDGVVWTNRINISAGELSFDAGTRRVIWTINRLPASIEELTADFEIALTPSAAQVGNPITLTDRATFEADDRAAGAHITLGADALDTNLAGDPVASGKGVVVP